MTILQSKPDLDQEQFQDTLFDLLMSKRIEHILLICSTYDAFIIEEDGRINETMFREYSALNLRYPPRFFKAHSAESALEILENENVDLVINMLSISDFNPFELSKIIKNKYSDIPLVVLTPFSREVSQKLASQDLSGVDYVFSWLGNTNLLMAIIKLIEDKMNTEFDVGEVGVQCVLLVEDSVRYYSSYLPNIYRIIIQQSREFMAEGLNEHQRTHRLRGRPKIMLATNFEQAIELYEKYKSNMLGIISDISFNRNGKKDKKAGIELCKIVKADDPYFPILLQSSDNLAEETISELKIRFIHKFSKTLLFELTDFLRDYLAFGCFRIINPEDGSEVARARDLQALHDIIYKIPDESLKYHIERNHFSKWLRARALFSLGRLFRQAKSNDFTSLNEVRDYLHDGMAKYRSIRGRGVIADFDRNKYNKYILFSRIGEGSIGGKARGLAFIDNILKRSQLQSKYNDIELFVPRTIVLATDIFSDFMERNNLYDFAISCNSDEEILNRFLQGELKYDVILNLKAILNIVSTPLAVRSSSLLEDSHYQPFAGIYSTYMIPNTGSNRDRLSLLMQCIKAVYASVYYQASKAYMVSTSNLIDEEKMAIVLQEVCGISDDGYFFPTLSGVARSINFYPISPEKAEDGVVSIAYGLGKYIVDGGMSLRFTPKYPEKIIQLSSVESMLKDTQKEFFAINLNRNNFIPSVDDDAHIERFSVSDGDRFSTFRHAASTYIHEDNMVVDGIKQKGRRVITFNPVLKYNTFPLAEILKDVFDLCAREMGKPVEIEFAVNIDNNSGNRIFNLLQIRPIVNNRENITIIPKQIDKDKCIVISELALGNGVYEDIYDIIYVVPEKFNAADTWKLAQEIEFLNKQMIAEKRNYILIGPGRWGSSDPWLGIPVKWPQISAARVIIEAGMKNFHIEPSQGTHFFQNLTSFRVAYFTVNDFINQGMYKTDFLNAQEALFDNGVIRHIRFQKPMEIMIDGKRQYGIISMPGINVIPLEND